MAGSLSRTKQKNKNLICEIALKTFREKGIANTSMNDIADNCGITRRTIYNYFENKTQLLQSLISDLFEKITIDFKIDYDYDKKAIENFKDFINNINENFLDHRDDIIFVSEIKSYLSYRMSREEYIENKYNYFFDSNLLNDIKVILQRGVQDKSIRDIDIDINDMVEILYQASIGFLTNLSNISSRTMEEYFHKTDQFTKMLIYYLEEK